MGNNLVLYGSLILTFDFLNFLRDPDRKEGPTTGRDSPEIQETLIEIILRGLKYI